MHPHSVHGDHPHYQSEDISFRRSGKFQHCPPPAPWLIRVMACNLLHQQGISDAYIQSHLRWTSNAFLGYLCNTLYSAATHTNALHIPERNLPDITTECHQVRLTSGDIVFTNSASRTRLPYNRARGELEQVLHLQAA